MRRLAGMTLLTAVLFGQTAVDAAKRQMLVDGASSEFARLFEGKAVGSPELNAQLTRVLQRLFVGARFQPVVIRSSEAEGKEAVAVAGKLFVPETLLARLKDDDELLGVLAHAIGHSGQEPVGDANGLVFVVMPFQCPATGFVLLPKGFARSGVPGRSC